MEEELEEREDEACQHGDCDWEGDVIARVTSATTVVWTCPKCGWDNEIEDDGYDG